MRVLFSSTWLRYVMIKILTIFGGKNRDFLENHCYDQLLAHNSSILNKNRHFFLHFFGENIF
jgi:hypothetical protein